MKQILTAAIRQAITEVSYENLDGEAVYNALLKLEHVIGNIA